MRFWQGVKHSSFHFIASFGPTFGKIGLLSVSTSSHTLSASACQHQIGRFLRVVGDIFSFKVGQNIWWLLALFKIQYFLSKNWIGYFWANFWKNWAPFYSNIWSYCAQHLPNWITCYSTWREVRQRRRRQRQRRQRQRRVSQLRRLKIEFFIQEIDKYRRNFLRDSLCHISRDWFANRYLYLR